MRMLVVEDATALRESLVMGLTGLGHSVDATGDGEEGLWYALGSDYDLLLLDIMVPKVSGLEIIRKVRAAAERQRVPILLLTARDEVEDRIAGLDAGADDYLTKPFAVGELLARIRALVRRNHQQPRAVVAVGDLEIDINERQVRKAGAEVPLTRREFALLEYLALRSGSLVSRTELWDHLYDFASEPNSNAIDVLVGRVRRKLCPPGTPQYIATRRGFGYRLSDSPAAEEPE